MALLASSASLLACAPTALAQVAAPETESAQVAVRPDCAVPPPGYARCAAEQLVYRASGSAVQVNPGVAGAPQGSPAAKPTATVTPATTEPRGPSELQSAYGLTTLSANAGSGKTVAIVDADDDPNAEADLNTYRSNYGLGECTETSGCFHKVEQSGTKASTEWSLEVSLDLDMVSAICPRCKILLVEAATSYEEDLAKAENTAAGTAGVVAVSNSYGLLEGSGGSRSWTNEQANAYSHAGVAITASAGDDGYEVEFPAVLSTVTAVGGTTLRKSGGVWSQTAWSGTGAGCSAFVAKPAWQTSLGAADSGCSMRSNNDVSADADPNTGAIVYDSYGAHGWELVGGTSASSPMIAAFYALVGQGAGVGGASWDYAHTEYFSDVIGGTDEMGCKSYLCEAVSGYDGPTGLGTPNGAAAGSVAGEGGSGSGTGAPGESGSGSETGGGGGSGQTPPQAPSPVVGAVTVSDSPSAGSPTASAASLIPSLSGLALTHGAIVTLDRAHPEVAEISFAFSLTAPARVRVTLARRTGSHRHARWTPLPYSITISAKRGRTSGHLRSHHALAPGSYELTLTPAHGAARSIVIEIG